MYQSRHIIDHFGEESKKKLKDETNLFFSLSILFSFAFQAMTPLEVSIFEECK